MPYPAIPVEFEDLLSPAGKRVLAGTHALCGALANPRTRFLARTDLLDRTKAERVRRVLEASLADQLELMERPIPPEVREHIFERFHRGGVGENIPGYGLGLNLARELARIHQGDLRLLTSEETWTEFEVKFRVSPPLSPAKGGTA